MKASPDPQRTSFLLTRRKLALRGAIVVTALAAIVGLFVALAGGGDEGTAASATQPQAQDTTEGKPQTRPSTTQPRSKPGATAETPSRPQAPAIDRVLVRGGKPVGGVTRLEYERGEHVRFSVRSDVADEVHIHGFDIARRVRANGTVRFGFPADIEGVFEVELENAQLKIAELRIRP